MKRYFRQFLAVFLIVFSFALISSPALALESLFSLDSADNHVTAINTAVDYVRDLYYKPEELDLKSMLRHGLQGGLKEATGDTDSAEISAVLPEKVGWKDLQGENLKARLKELFARHGIDEPPVEEVLFPAAKAMIGSIRDPYTRLIKPSQYKNLETETSQEFGGLGIYISFENGNLTVVAPIKGTPAFKAGLQPRDQIVQIDGEPASKLDNVQEAVKRLRGKKGSTVELTILRNGNRFDVKLTRAVIPIRTVYSRMVDKKNGIAVLRITNFGERTANEVVKELKSLRKQGLNGLILDLRGNPGGLLSGASRVADLWIKQGSLVRTQGRTEKQSSSFPASEQGIFNDYKMAVLVNGGSASGSEIVAGALKAHERAILLGEQTYGKGLVQSVFPLEDGSALSLTTARYFTPDNEPIHGEGLTPQITVSQQTPDTQAQKELRKLTQGDTIARWIREHENLTKIGGGVPDQLVNQLREQGFRLDRKYIELQYNQELARKQGRTLVIDPGTDPQLHKSLEIFRNMVNGDKSVAEVAEGMSTS